MFTATLFTITKTGKQPKRSMTNEGQRRCHIHIHVRASQSLRSCPTLRDSMDYSPSGSCVRTHSRKNAGVGCQGSSPAPGSNPHLLCLLHCRWILHHWAAGEALHTQVCNTHTQWRIMRKNGRRHCNNTDVTKDYHHSKWSQSEMKTNVIQYHLRVESKTWHKWAFMKKEENHRYREETCGCQCGGWSWGGLGVWNERRKHYTPSGQQGPTVFNARDKP